MKKIFCIIMLVCTAMIFAACNGNEANDYEIDEYEVVEYEVADNEQPEPAYTQPSTGRIFLFGELHGNQNTMLRQIEIWGEFYHNYGMRHLFIETGYATAQFLNMWMQADDDVILHQLFDNWRGTAKHTQYQLDFYRTIKLDFPETIFHGTDVEHTTLIGNMFLQQLRGEGLEGTPSYQTTRLNMAQFNRFRNASCHSVRAYYKPQNFIRAFDELVGQDVMAIHGGPHVTEGVDFLGLEGVASMATTLRERYGDRLQTFDMMFYPQAQVIMTNKTGVLEINGTAFYATYYGRSFFRFTTQLGDIVARDFWRVHDAYDYFADRPDEDDVFPHSNFIMGVNLGDVFVVDAHLANGDVQRLYFRDRGGYWDERRTTQAFIP